MKNHATLLTTAITGLLALGACSQSGDNPTTSAATPMEKCAGVAKAGKNDCQTSTSACAGTSTQDGQADAWIYVPKGTCDRVVGGKILEQKT